MAALITKIKNFGIKHYNIFIIGLLAVLGAHLIVYILFFSKSLLNSDSTFIVDYALEAIKHKTLFPKTWVNTNDFWVYSLIPLIIPLLKAKVPLFLARQIPVLIQTGLLLFFTYDIHKRFLKNKKGSIYLLALLMAGVSGQFAFEVFADATYGSIIFFMILSIWLLLGYLNCEKKIGNYFYVILFFVINSLITTCSLRFPVMLSAPIICALLVLLYKNGFKKKYIIWFGLIIASIIIGYIGHKFLLNNLLLEASYGDNILGNKNELIDAVSNVVFNYLYITGGTRLNTYSLTTYIWNDFISKDSPLIVLIFIQFLSSIGLLIAPLLLLKKIKKFEDYELVIYIIAVSLTIIMLFFLIIGGMHSWYRYITPIVFMLMLLIPLLYKYFFNDILKNRIVFLMVIFMICLSSLIMVCYSYFDYDTKKLRKNPSQELADYLVSKDLHFGYKYYGGEQNLYSLYNNNELRVVPIKPSGVEPHYWLNSTDWYKEDAYDGKVFFIRKSFDNHLDYEDEAIDQFPYKDYEIIVFKDISVFTKRFEKERIKKVNNEEKK